MMTNDTTPELVRADYTFTVTISVDIRNVKNSHSTVSGVANLITDAMLNYQPLADALAKTGDMMKPVLSIERALLWTSLTPTAHC